ncbi:MAG TPA: glycosyltransferase family 1 protein [Casimicrobiaceae bacterium]
MLRLLYVALTENDQVRGVERYALELVRQLATQHAAEIRITLLCGAWQSYFRVLEPLGVEIVVAPCRNSRASRHAFLLTRLRGQSAGFDLVHYGNLMPIAIPNRAPSTMTIHDVAEYAIARKYSLFRVLYRRIIGWLAARIVVHVLTDSEFSRNEIAFHLGIDRKRVTVIYPGVDHFRRHADVKEMPQLPKRYFLYYGVIEETKGADTAILAFNALRDDPLARDVALVLVGRPGNAYERLRALIDGRRIVHVGHLDDAALQRCIEGALAVVFVSRYEGFGLPAVESYMLNDTVIASSGHSVGEIARGFAWLVDENRQDAVTAAMRGVLMGERPTRTLDRDAVQRRFSWSDAARRALTVFNAHARSRATCEATI